MFAANEDGEREKLPIYEYEYEDKGYGTGRHVGPMAQDVERIDPGAVGRSAASSTSTPAR